MNTILPKALIREEDIGIQGAITGKRNFGKRQIGTQKTDGKSNLKALKRIVLGVLIVMMISGMGASGETVRPMSCNWYEVFVRSYQDSNGDGIGDLNGLMNRLDYIENMGYKIIRFTNREIDKEFYSVCSVIDSEVNKRTLPQSSPKGDDSSLKEGAKA